MISFNFRKPILFILILFLGHAGNGLGAENNQLYFSVYTAEDGLSVNQINCIYQDSYGFMWIGTTDGLNRFDGYEFVKHTAPDSSGLSTNSIHTIVEDQQNNLWMGTTNGLTHYNRRTDTYTHFYHDPNDPFSLPSNFILQVIYDRRGTLWLATDIGLVRSNPRDSSFALFSHPQYTGKNEPVTAISHDKQGTIWFYADVLYALNPDSNTLEKHKFDFQNQPESVAVFDIENDSTDNVWISTNVGLFRFNSTTFEFYHFRHDPNDKYSLGGNYVRGGVQVDAQNNLWVGCGFDGGLNYYDQETGRFITYLLENNSKRIQTNNSLNTLYLDRQGGLWSGIHHEGLYYFDTWSKPFRHYSHVEKQTADLSFNKVSCILEDNQGHLLIGTERGGLNRFDFNTESFEHFLHNPADSTSLGTNIITCLYKDSKDRIWVGTYGSGLGQFHLQTKTFTQYDVTSDPSHNVVNDIEESATGTLWLATSLGLFRLNPENGDMLSVELPQQVTNKVVRHLMYDQQGRLWASTYDGLFQLQGVKWSGPVTLPGAAENINIIDIYNDKAGDIWLGTALGLWQLDPEGRVLNHYTKEHGLTDNFVCSIVQDDAGNIWTSTYNGLSCLNIADSTFRNFYKEDGLQGNYFLHNSVCKRSNGELVFGGNNGFNVFHPDDIRTNPIPPNVYLTGLQVINQDIEVGVKRRGNVILEESLIHAEKIVLSHLDYAFSITFAALHYALPERNQYAYRLLGFEEEWNVVDAKHRVATYTNLNPGSYTFQVLASNNDGLWNEHPATLRIVITPPFWQTPFAFAIYGMLLISLLFTLRWSIIKRECRKAQLAMERQQAQQTHELDQLKLRFFTNVSHELRTPLTLIIAPLEKLLENSRNLSRGLRERYLRLTLRSAERLLRLVNQILDIQKLDSNTMRLERTRGDVIAFLKSIFETFQISAEQRNILFTFYAEHDSFEAAFDADKLDKILFNLLSNAFKFTPNDGQISVSITIESKQPSAQATTVDTELCISVADTGAGIPEEKLEHIFTLFYQDKHTSDNIQGTGIGLALTKELTELHGGEIRVQSTVGKGSTFKVFIPLEVVPPEHNAGHCKSKQEIDHSDQSNDVHPVGNTKDEDAPLLLIIEDDADLIDYLKTDLIFHYRIAIATNGKQGLDLALHVQPDLIISDVMMPHMNGFEVCRQLKNDERMSHIPIILLTARATDDSQITGLQLGADDYVTKPFNSQVLYQRISNLLDSRKRLRERFSREIHLKPADIVITSADENFLNRAISVVDKNLSDPEFSVDAFSRQVGFSRVHLYRKLQALTNQSPREFIRFLRLKRAALLLIQGRLNVSETSYKVGFKEVSHFTSSFRKQFGITPSEYIQRETSRNA